MRWSMNTILPRTASSGASRSESTLSKPITSPVTPSGPVKPLPPSPLTTSFCGKGARISALSAPRRQDSRHTYGAIDLGTNNCRLLIARPTGDNFTVVDAFSRVVRLLGLSFFGRGWFVCIQLEPIPCPE